MRYWFLVLTCCLAARPVQLAAQRVYWKTSIARVVAKRFLHTHIELDSVTVVYTTIEADSDVHIRVRDQRDSHRADFMVAECIPKLPCKQPKVGDVISLRGIIRWDLVHRWWEIHPVEVLWP